MDDAYQMDEKLLKEALDKLPKPSADGKVQAVSFEN